jgi:hypothetical protein
MNKSSPRLPSPAIVIAIIALFVSLGGTGYAASQLSGSPTAVAGKSKKTKKPVVKTLRGKTGPTGPNGPTGATGLSGLTGAQGKEGKEGSQGKEGPQGEAPATLPTGHSESGTYAVAGSAKGTFTAQGFAFPLPLAAPLNQEHVAWLNGTTTASCPGVGKAANGFLCVYAQSAASVAPNNGHAVNSHLGLPGTDTGGFMLFFNVEAEGGFSYGSWTVTGA